MSPMAPVPNRQYPRQLNGAISLLYGVSGAGPSHTSQFIVLGTDWAAGHFMRTGACGQIGRLVQIWISLTLPIAPAWMASTPDRSPGVAFPWLPIWLTIFISLATSRIMRASATVCVRGFWV